MTTTRTWVGWGSSRPAGAAATSTAVKRTPRTIHPLLRPVGRPDDRGGRVAGRHLRPVAEELVGRGGHHPHVLRPRPIERARDRTRADQGGELPPADGMDLDVV